MKTKTDSVLSSLKDAILKLQDEIKITLECWKEPMKNEIGTNWNLKKTDWRK